MNWKENLVELESKNDFKSAINLIHTVIEENPHDADAYIRGIYLLHNILLEEDYPEAEHNSLEKLLRTYFATSYAKFSNEPEYLFFVGKILYIAEWYFGLRDDDKPLIERQAFLMQKKAHEMKRENILYEWAYRFTLGDEVANHLAKNILLYEENTTTWLKSKGFPGKYILDSLKYSAEIQCYKI